MSRRGWVEREMGDNDQVLLDSPSLLLTPQAPRTPQIYTDWEHGRSSLSRPTQTEIEREREGWFTSCTVR